MEMRKAMADAEVGDDVLDHDPTMAALEEEVAHTLGLPAALWVPSGSMGNLIALMLHLHRGDQFLVVRIQQRAVEHRAAQRRAGHAGGGEPARPFVRPVGAEQCLARQRARARQPRGRTA